MPNSILSEEATLTERYQTTVPAAVRKALNLHKGEKIRYVIEESGRVILSRAESSDEDPALQSFLMFLAADINKHPEHLQSINSSLLKRVQNLVKGVELDLNAPLADEDD